MRGGRAGAPAIVLVPGFKDDRGLMLPWARFLNAAGDSVLLLDRRGCGASDGWAIALGAREQEDVIAAVTYLERALGDVPVGVLGVSLGAGIALRGAAADPRIAAVVADSAWTDQNFQLDRLRSVRVGAVDVPLLPYAEPLVDAIAGADVRVNARPLDAIARLGAQQAVFLIHSVDDGNATTPPSAEAALFAAAHEPKQEWRTTGGHIGAINAHTDEYRDRVLAFFARYLR
jgi:pimeloyl-ACP methyl ester carboxylesterase